MSGQIPDQMLADAHPVGQHDHVDDQLTAGNAAGNVADVRTEMLARRKALPPDVVERHSATVVQRIRSLPEVRGLMGDGDQTMQGRALGAYVGVRGEIDPSALLEDPGLRVGLPVTTSGEPLRFVVPDGPLVEGPFGIRQPGVGTDVDPMSLSVVLVPLVAADRKGNRIGHGAGFYDRTFAPLATDRPAGPLLIGVCHDFQVVSEIEARPWDVPLDLLVTEVGLIRPEA